MQRLRRSAIPPSIAVAALLLLAASSTARAAPPSCEDPFIAGQRATKSGQLLAARQSFQACAATTCPKSAQDDCNALLAEVNGRIPSIVLTAAIGGSPSADVAVTMDDKPLAASLDGRAVEVDPGMHVFVFTTSDGKTKRVNAPIVEGKKAQEVHADFEGVVVAVTKGETTGNVTGAAEHGSSWSGWKTAGLVVAGVGVVTGAIGLLVWRSGQSTVDDVNDQCRAADAVLCNSGGSLDDQRNSAKSKVTTGRDVAIVGGALVAIGVVTVLLAPSTRSTSTATGVTHVGFDGRGLVLAGRF